MYLKNFAEDKKHLYVFDKDTGEIFSSKVDDVCQKKGFYDFPLRGKKSVDCNEDQLAENMFSMLEGNHAPMLEKFIATVNKRGYVDDRLKSDMAYFVAVTMTRGTRVREDIKQFVNQAANKKLDDLRNQNEVNISKDIQISLKENSLKAVHSITAAKSFEGIARILTSGTWRVAINKTEVPFITSDSPVAVVNPIRGPFHQGVEDVGTMVHISITPQIRLLIFNERCLDNAGVRYLDIYDKDIVFIHNMAVTEGAIKQVYSVGDDFSQIKLILSAQSRRQEVIS